MWKKCYSFAEQDYYKHVKYVLSVSLDPTRSLKLSLSKSLSFTYSWEFLWFHRFSYYSQRLKFEDFSTSLPSLIFRELWLPITKLYIFGQT